MCNVIYVWSVMDLHSFEKRWTRNISVVRTPLLVTTELLVDGSALLGPVGYNVKLENFVFLRVRFNWIILFDWMSKWIVSHSSRATRHRLYTTASALMYYSRIPSIRHSMVKNAQWSSTAKENKLLRFYGHKHTCVQKKEVSSDGSITIFNNS